MDIFTIKLTVGTTLSPEQNETRKHFAATERRGNTVEVYASAVVAFTHLYT